MKVNDQLRAPAALLSWKETQYPLAKALVGLRAGLDGMAKRKISYPCRYRTPVLQ